MNKNYIPILSRTIPIIPLPTTTPNTYFNVNFIPYILFIPNNKGKPIDCEEIKNEIINPFGIPSIATVFIKGIIACGHRKINILIIET